MIYFLIPIIIYNPNTMITTLIIIPIDPFATLTSILFLKVSNNTTCVNTIEVNALAKLVTLTLANIGLLFFYIYTFHI